MRERAAGPSRDENECGRNIFPVKMNEYSTLVFNEFIKMPAETNKCHAG